MEIFFCVRLGLDNTRAKCHLGFMEKISSTLWMCITYPSSGKLATGSLLLGKHQSTSIMEEVSLIKLEFQGIDEDIRDVGGSVCCISATDSLTHVRIYTAMFLLYLWTDAVDIGSMVLSGGRAPAGRAM